MGQGFLYGLTGLFLYFRKASNEVAKEVTCRLDGCISNVAKTASYVALEHCVVVLNKPCSVLFEVPFMRSVPCQV